MRELQIDGTKGAIRGWLDDVPDAVDRPAEPLVAA
jgi:hypothetical protein